MRIIFIKLSKSKGSKAMTVTNKANFGGRGNHASDVVEGGFSGLKVAVRLRRLLALASSLPNESCKSMSVPDS